MPDRDVRLDDWDDPNSTVQVAGEANVQDVELHAKLAEISALLVQVEVAVARIQGRIRRLEQRPVITVQHTEFGPIPDYREAL